METWSPEYKLQIVNELNEAQLTTKELQARLDARRVLNDELRLENTKLRLQIKANSILRNANRKQYLELRRKAENLANAAQAVLDDASSYDDIVSVIFTEFISGLDDTLTDFRRLVPSGEDEPGYAEMQYQAHTDL